MLKQIPKLPDAAVQDFRVVAVLKATPEELGAKTGVTFVRATDDLGPVQTAFIECDGVPFALERYDDSLDTGTQVYGKEWKQDLMYALDTPTTWRAV